MQSSKSEVNNGAEVYGRDYSARVARELAEYRNVDNVHDLPAIFHYWSNSYIRPLVEPFGFVGAEQFFAKYLLDIAGRIPGEELSFISIGAGNCDTEVRVAELLRASGLSRFRFDCLELNHDMLARGEELARGRDLSERFRFVEGDFNQWSATGTYHGIVANQSLHHVVNLERLFEEIHSSLDPRGYFITSDIIGRNGHMRWPEVLPTLQAFWKEMPPAYRFNQQLKRYEDAYENWDCSTESFEGVRAQDVLPLLLERFHFRVFIGFCNLVEIFVSRAFGHNFDAEKEWDKKFIDRLHKVDEDALLSGTWAPTQMMAVLSRTEGEPTLSARGLTPEMSLRVTRDERARADNDKPTLLIPVDVEKRKWVDRLVETEVLPGASDVDARAFLQFLDASKNDIWLDQKTRFLQTYIRFARHVTVGKRQSVAETGRLSAIGSFLAERGFNVTALGGDFRYHIDAPDASCEVILSLEVLEHITDQDAQNLDEIAHFSLSGVRQFVAEMYRCLTPGGTLVLTTPNACSLFNLVRLLQGESPVMFSPHIKEYSPNEVVRICSDQGFVLKMRDTMNGLFYLERSEREELLRSMFTERGASSDERGDIAFFIFERPND